MNYETVVLPYQPKAPEMAAAIEEKANEMACDSWKLVTFSITPAARAILVFCRAENTTVQAAGGRHEETESA